MWDLLELGIKPISSELAGGFFLVVCISRRHLLLGRRAMTNLDSIVKSKGITADKVLIVKAMVFPVVMYGWMWELDHEGWALKNWCFQTVVLEKALESPLDGKEIGPVNPRGNQPWIFTGRTEAEAPILWPPDAKSQFIGKDPDAGKDWRQEEKWAAVDETVRQASLTQRTWIWANSSEGEGSLVCYSPWGHKGSDMT